MEAGAVIIYISSECPQARKLTLELGALNFIFKTTNIDHWKDFPHKRT